MKSFKTFMSEKHVIDRWFIVVTAIFGAFCGALLATAFIIAFGLGYP